MSRPWKHRYRYIVLVIGLLGLTSISSNTLAFNLAQVCMSSTSHLNDSSNASRLYPIIDYSPSEVSLVNGAMAVGLAVATFPSTIIFSRYGMKWPLFISGCFSAFSTAMMPLASTYHIYAVLVVRVFQGFSYASNLPAIGKLCSNWSSLKQTGVFIAVLTSYMSLSSGLTNSLGGFICETRYGWPLVYWAHSVVSVIVFTLWLLIYKDAPSLTRQVTSRELSKIHLDKTEAQMTHQKIIIPYRFILSDILVWVIWMNAFVEFFITIFLTLYTPFYIHNALKYSAGKTGYYASISRISQVPFRLLFGYASDKIKFLNENVKLILFNSIALASAGLCLLGLGFVPDSCPILGVILLTIISMSTGAASSGFFKGAVLYTRQFNQFVIGICQFIKCGILFLAPIEVAAFVTDSADRSQWRIIFISTGISALIVNALFCRFSQADPAAYTADGFDFNSKKTNKSEV